jgi:pimeloyl-ACP methyl ester carboxylesterase
MAERRTATIDLSSGPLTYELSGSGPPLVWLHPAGGVRWSPVLERLSEIYTLHVPVAPGFDGTPRHDKVNSMKALAGLFGEFIDRVVGGRTVLMGHSFGGWAALWLTALRPDLVTQLVVEAPAGFRPEGSPPLPADPAALKSALFAHPENAPAAIDPAKMVSNHANLPHYGGGQRWTDEELLARLPEIVALTLILHGTADQLVPKESVQLVRSCLRHAYLVYVWDAAHAIQIDQPQRMLEVVESFLQRGDAFIVNWNTAAVG